MKQRAYWGLSFLALASYLAVGPAMTKGPSRNAPEKIEIQMILPLSKIGQHMTYLQFEPEDSVDEAFAALGSRAEMVRFYLPVDQPLDACLDVTDCVRAIATVCQVSQHGSLQTVEFGDGCGGDCDDGFGVHVGCAEVGDLRDASADAKDAPPVVVGWNGDSPGAARRLRLGDRAPTDAEVAAFATGKFDTAEFRADGNDVTEFLARLTAEGAAVCHEAAGCARGIEQLSPDGCVRGLTFAKDEPLGCRAQRCDDTKVFLLCR